VLVIKLLVATATNHSNPPQHKSKGRITTASVNNKARRGIKHSKIPNALISFIVVG
jgi:hypothetical protein